MQPPLYFWRDQNGRIEIDCLIDKGIELVPIEIKSGQTIVPDFFRGLEKWNEATGTAPSNNIIVFAGQNGQNRSQASVIDWKSSGILIQKIES